MPTTVIYDLPAPSTTWNYHSLLKHGQAAVGTTSRLLERFPLLAEALLVLVVLGSLFCLKCGPILTGRHTIAAGPDNTHLLLPLLADMDRVCAAGEYPYRMESISGGLSLYNNPQICARYPFYFLGWSLYDSPLHASLTAHRVILLHLFLLSLNMYVLIRHLGLGRLAALTGAVLAAYNLNTYSYMVWIQIIAPYSWLPLAVCGVYLVLENQRPWRGIALGTLGIPMLVLASPAQPLIHFVIIASVLTAVASGIRIYRRQPILVPWRYLALLGVLSLILGAPALVPSARELSHMIRWVGDAPPVIGNAPIPYKHFLLGEMEPGDLAHCIVPYPLKHIIGDSYFGILPLFLALCGLWSYQRNWFVPTAAMLGGYALLSSTGEHLGFAQINYTIPLLNKIREPGRHLILFVLTFSCLSAFGIQFVYDELRRANILRQSSFWVAAVLCTALAILAFRGTEHRIRHVADTITIGSCLAFTAVLVGATYGKAVLHRLPAWRWHPNDSNNRALRVSGLLLGASVVIPQLAIPLDVLRLEQNDYFDGGNLRAHRILSRVAQLPDIHEQRVVFEDDQYSFQSWCMDGSYHGVNSFHSTMNPQNYEQFLDNCYTFSCNPITRLWGARYAVCNAKNPPLPDPYRQIDEIEGYRIYEATDAWPRAVLCNRINGTYNSRAEFVTIANSVPVVSEGVYVRAADREQVAAFFGSEPYTVQGRIQSMARTANKAEYQVSTTDNSMLVFNEYQRGEWKVLVDGHPIHTLLVNSNRPGVLLTPGQHRVSFNFEPRVMLWLLRIQTIVLAAMVCGAGVVLSMRIRRGGQSGRKTGLEIAPLAA